MAPGVLIDDASCNRGNAETQQKPTVYILDEYHPVAIQRAQKLFNTILPDNSECRNWRENAEYILVSSENCIVRGSRSTC